MKPALPVHQCHDIPDSTWELLERHLPGRKGTWGGNARDNRQFINAVFWILRADAAWRDLPPDYGDWKNTHRRFCRWRDKGVWEKLLEILIDRPDYEWLMIDASHVMACTKGSAQRYPWPWMRMVCRSEWLSRQMPLRITRKLAGRSKE